MRSELAVLYICYILLYLALYLVDACGNWIYWNSLGNFFEVISEF